jgi:pilus assembly protein CpaB
LVLRNPLDTETAKTPGTAMARLFSDGSAPKPVAVAPRRAPAPAPKVVEKPAPRIYLIEVINGSKRSEEKFGAAEHQ